MNFLEMEKISKSFGAINALQGVDFFKTWRSRRPYG